jgi:uncharacterized membrane protein YqaE (UPF0057 family)
MADTTALPAAPQGLLHPTLNKQARDAVGVRDLLFRGPPGDQPVPALDAPLVAGSTSAMAPRSHVTAANAAPIADAGGSSGAATAGAVAASGDAPTRQQEPDAVEVLCDVCVPPIGVAIATDMDVPEVAINCVLSLFGWLPGVIHALVVSFSPSRVTPAVRASRERRHVAHAAQITQDHAAAVAAQDAQPPRPV